MIRKLTTIAVGGLLLAACEPTERTNPDAVKAREIARVRAEQQQAAAAAQAEADRVRLAEAAAEAARAAAEAAKARQAGPDASGSILVINSTLQNYNIMQPWEKEAVQKARAMGVSLGNGLVLTLGEVVRAATYVEIGLPDQSRTVPAKVLRYDEELNLALLTVQHESDASVIGERVALQTGEPLRQGDAAELAGLVNGLVPVKVPLVVESAESATMPQLLLRASHPVPAGHDDGAPVMKEGRLVGLTTNYNSQGMRLSVINAEIIQRFLSQDVDAVMPVLGLEFAGLKDPVFRSYLKLDKVGGGLYISKVHPGGAAELVGVRPGDVLLAIDGMDVDNVGRCHHPLYGPIHASTVLRGHKPVGDTMSLTVSREGQLQTLNLTLDRKARDARLFAAVKPGKQPCYVMWGGLLFQPLTENYLETLRRGSGGNLPLEFQQLEDGENELRESGVTELVALTAVVPTPATLGYETLRFCRIEAVNDKPVQSFAQFVSLLDEPTDNGIVKLRINKPPFHIYMDRKAAEESNELLQAKAISPLRVVE